MDVTNILVLTLGGAVGKGGALPAHAVFASDGNILLLCGGNGRTQRLPVFRFLYGRRMAGTL